MIIFSKHYMAQKYYLFINALDLYKYDEFN